MQFVSLKLMWRIPRKTFTSHCCRHRWLEHRWMYRYIPTCATAVLRTDRIYNFGVLWMCMFYRRLSSFFSTFRLAVKALIFIIIGAEYTELVYKLWRARQIFFVCAHNLKQLSYVYSHFYREHMFVIGALLRAVYSSVHSYLNTCFLSGSSPQQYSDQIKWSLWKYIIIIICLRVLRSLCIYAYRRPFVDGMNGDKWSTVGMQFNFRVRSVSWPKSECEAEKHIDSSHWVLNWNDFEWEWDDDKSLPFFQCPSLLLHPPAVHYLRLFSVVARASF